MKPGDIVRSRKFTAVFSNSLARGTASYSANDSRDKKAPKRTLAFLFLGAELVDSPFDEKYLDGLFNDLGLRRMTDKEWGKHVAKRKKEMEAKKCLKK